MEDILLGLDPWGGEKACTPGHRNVSVIEAECESKGRNDIFKLPNLQIQSSSGGGWRILSKTARAPVFCSLPFSFIFCLNVSKHFFFFKLCWVLCTLGLLGVSLGRVLGLSFQIVGIQVMLSSR